MSDMPGDPEFSITDPPNGAQVNSTFSVYGSCSAITSQDSPTITVTVGSAPAVTAQNNADAKTWEAIIDNAPAGAQTVTASCTLEGHTLTATAAVTVGSANNPVFTVNAPTATGAAAEGGNPFAKLTVGGTYDTALDVLNIFVYVTKKGLRVSSVETASLDAGGWSLPLSSLPLSRAQGQGFCVHAMAQDSQNVFTLGSIPSFLTATPGDE